MLGIAKYIVGPSNNYGRNFQILSKNHEAFLTSKYAEIWFKHIKRFIQILVFNIFNQKMIINGIFNRIWVIYF